MAAEQSRESNDEPIACGACDGLGVLAEGQSCDMCGGTGEQLPATAPADPPDTPPTVDMFEGKEDLDTVDPERPKGFNLYDESIDVNLKCPKCGHEWSE